MRDFLVDMAGVFGIFFVIGLLTSKAVGAVYEARQRRKLMADIDQAPWN